VSALLAALVPAGTFYPVFLAFLALWIGGRALARRFVGARSWATWTRAFEGGVLAVLIFAMVGFAVLQIVLRNVFHAGVVWIEPLLRYFVLWIGFIAAIVATGRLRHIQINVIGRLLPPGPRLAVTRLTLAVAAAICAALARGAWVYLADEQSFGGTAFLDIPVWVLTSVIFAGFALMSARFAARATEGGESLSTLLREGETDGA